MKNNFKIANIVYEKSLINHTQVDYINYYNQLIEYDKLDKTLPTLYVGWSFMRACNPDNEIIKNANILNKRIISNELYWEFSFEESKSSHVKGVESFVDHILQYYFIPKYKYINLDPVFFQIVDVDGLMDVLPKKIDVTYILKNEMLFVLVENKIWGINLNMYKYFKFNIEEILDRIKERTNTSHIDIDSEIYQTYYKLFPNFTLLKRFLVVLVSK